MHVLKQCVPHIIAANVHTYIFVYNFTRVSKHELFFETSRQQFCLQLSLQFSLLFIYTLIPLKLDFKRLLQSCQNVCNSHKPIHMYLRLHRIYVHPSVCLSIVYTLKFDLVNKWKRFRMLVQGVC